MVHRPLHLYRIFFDESSHRWEHTWEVEMDVVNWADATYHEAVIHLAQLTPIYSRSRSWSWSMEPNGGRLTWSDTG